MPSVSDGVEFLDEPHPERPGLRGVPYPLPNEALYSWLRRWSSPFGISPARLVLATEDLTRLGGGLWWLHPSESIVAAISRQTGVPNERVHELTFRVATEGAVRDEVALRFSRQRYYLKPRGESRVRTALCFQCLDQDLVPYYRREWMVGWVALCPVHHSLLEERCTKCGTPFDTRSLSHWQRYQPELCVRCSQYPASTSPTSAHPLVIDFQSRLIAARQSGLWSLPDGRTIEWSSALILFSVLLTLFWTKTTAKCQISLAKLINADLGPEALSSQAASNYHGMLFLAWILSAWPAHLRQVTRTKQYTVKALTDRQAGLGDISKRLELIHKVLTPVWPRNVSSYPLTPKRRNRSQPLDARAYQQLRKYIVKQLQYHGATLEDAEDVTQDAFVRLARWFWRVRGVAQFLRTAAKNLRIDEIRKRQCEVRNAVTIDVLYGGRYEARDAFRVLSGEETVRLLIASLRKMPAKHREAWWDVRVHGERVQPLACRHGVTLKCIEKRLKCVDRRLGTTDWV